MFHPILSINAFISINARLTTTALFSSRKTQSILFERLSNNLWVYKVHLFKMCELTENSLDEYLKSYSL